MTLKSMTRAVSPTEQPKRGWSVRINGAPVPDAALVEVEHPRFGLLTYGWTPGGYDGWTFCDPGGVVMVPYAEHEGTLWIGVVEQRRFTQGGMVLNLPRGFIDPGESHDDAARRELSEETGIDEVALWPLPGEPVNANSAFFETPDAGQGVRFYALRVPAAWLVFGEGRPTVDAARLKASSTESRAAEQIGSLRFIPWTEAAGLADMFTVAGVARLMAGRRSIADAADVAASR